jgi:hypothetical protein
VIITTNDGVLRDSGRGAVCAVAHAAAKPVAIVETPSRRNNNPVMAVRRMAPDG